MKIKSGDKVKHWNDIYTVEHIHPVGTLWVFRYTAEGDYVHGVLEAEDVNPVSLIELMLIDLKENGHV